MCICCSATRSVAAKRVRTRKKASRCILFAAVILELFLFTQPSMAASPDTVATLIKRTEEQARAFNSGDMTRWHGMILLSGDFTLMQPFGGAASHGFDGSPEHIARLSRLFRNGDAKLEDVTSYASDDLIVLAFIERQNGEVHGLPDQDWSLRVTQVYRRQGSQWQLVHRHADPLVRPIGLDKAAALARGE